MERADKGLAFLLQYENIAWYENGAVRILDRRCYPMRVEYVTCRTHEEVTAAIRDMVTQSGGPYVAAAMGMALAAYEVQGQPEARQMEHLKQAAHTLSHARPTTTKRMELIVNGCLEAAKTALDAGQDPVEALVQHNIEVCNVRYTRMQDMAENLVNLFPKTGKVMTQCYAETIVGMMLRVAGQRGYNLSFICPETRPYFQGARLTASVIRDQGFDVTVITDNMPAFTMQTQKVDAFTSGADAICMDGHVVNKVGTLQIALAAHYNGIPYFVTGVPDKGHVEIDDVTIENRNPQLALEALGVRTTLEGVKGYYPAFDITPPHLVSGVVTNKGVYSPYDLDRYYVGEGKTELIL